MGAFWEDLNERLEDAEFRQHYVLSTFRIRTVDALVNVLDARRQACGLSKADLARAVGRTPETVRRLLSVERPNPTLGTYVELAAALGMKVTLQPMTDEEQKGTCGQGGRQGRLAPS